MTADAEYTGVMIGDGTQTGGLLDASEAWSRFSATMLDLTGMPAALFTPSGNPTSVQFRFEDNTPICSLIQASPAGWEACTACNRRQFARVAETGKVQRYRCHLGLIDIALPVFQDEELVAIISTGQLLPEAWGEAGFQALAGRCTRFGIDREQLRRAYMKAPFLTETKIESVIALLTFFAEYLCEMSRRIRDLTEVETPAPIRQALDMVSERLSDDLSPEEVASSVGYSAGHFGRRFRQVVGRPFSDYVRDARIAKAKRELTSSPRLIAEIALGCGFGSLSQFNRAFRKATGATPREYRKEAAKKPARAMARAG